MSCMCIRVGESCTLRHCRSRSISWILVQGIGIWAIDSMFSSCAEDSVRGKDCYCIGFNLNSIHPIWTPPNAHQRKRANRRAPHLLDQITSRNPQVQTAPHPPNAGSDQQAPHCPQKKRAGLEACPQAGTHIPVSSGDVTLSGDSCTVKSYILRLSQPTYPASS